MTSEHYNGRIFRGRTNSENGEMSNETYFYYSQDGDVLTGRYAGGTIEVGQLLGVVNADGSLDFCYHHLNTEGEIVAGRCHSEPSRDEDGILMLDETWSWLTGDRSSGTSQVEEVQGP